MGLSEANKKKVKVIEKYIEILSKMNQSFGDCITNETEIADNFEVNLTLEYMIQSNKKYLIILNSLSEDERAGDLLERFYSQLTVNPLDDLDGFINQVHRTIYNELFIDELEKLSEFYHKDWAIRTIGSLLIAVVGFVIIIVLMCIVSPVFILSIIPGSLAYFYLQKTASESKNQSNLLSDFKVFLKQQALDTHNNSPFHLTNCIISDNKSNVTTRKIVKEVTKTKGEIHSFFATTQVRDTQTLKDIAQSEITKVFNCSAQ